MFAGVHVDCGDPPGWTFPDRQTVLPTVEGRPGPSRDSEVATATQSECVVPRLLWDHPSFEVTPGSTCSRKQLPVDVMNITPWTGSATGGPVMLTPPPPPGQFQVGPSRIVDGPGRVEQAVEEIAVLRDPGAPAGRSRACSRSDVLLRSDPGGRTEPALSGTAASETAAHPGTVRTLEPLRSSIGQIGSPVSRSRAYRNVLLRRLEQPLDLPTVHIHIH